MKKKYYLGIMPFVGFSVVSSLAFVSCHKQEIEKPAEPVVSQQSVNQQSNGLPLPMKINPIPKSSMKYFNGEYPLSPAQIEFINQKNGEWNYDEILKADQLQADAYAIDSVVLEIVGNYFTSWGLSFFNDEASQVIWDNKAVDYPLSVIAKKTASARSQELIKLWKAGAFKLPWEVGAKIVAPKMEKVDKQSKANSNNSKSLAKTIRIGHWNVLNLSITSKKPKRKAIAELIQQENMNLVGLTEIKNEQAIQEMIDNLNVLDPKAQWKFLFSPKGSSVVGSKGQLEHVAILYQSKMLEPIPFQGYSTAGLIYRNDVWENPFIPGMNINYVRPPYGAKFKVTKTGEDFTVVYSHNDAPGPKRGRKHDPSASRHGFSGQGLQEVNEALRLNKVMEWFDEIDGDNEDLFYMGDTNIRKGNEAKAFKPLMDAGYTSLLPDHLEEAKTTINNSNGWASPYDKMFYKGTYKFTNVRRGDIVNQWEQFKSTGIGKARDISDHAMTLLDLYITN